ncbi:MAG: helix-turn-helix domain-containing protein [Limisphaerales bacterium]
MRELENVIQRAAVMAKGDLILPRDLPAEIGKSENSEIPKVKSPPVLSKTGTGIHPDIVSIARQLFGWARQESRLKILPAVERELIICALSDTKGNQVQAAKLLGITRATLRKRIEKFKIKQQLSIE